MQIEHELCARLRIGGKWYNRGEKVMLDERDADIYRSRGISKPTVKAEKNQSSIPASQIGAITKQIATDETPPETKAAEPPPETKTVELSPETKTENTNHGKSRGKGR